jgi:hypothetical protein
MKITDEMINRANNAYYTSRGSMAMRAALEAAFPEPQPYNIGPCAIIPNEQPAVFGRLVVTDDILDTFVHDWWDKDVSSIEALQNFVDRHAMQPRSMKNDPPKHGDRIYVSCEHNYSPRWFHFGTVDEVDNIHRLKEYNWWLPASALPVPEVVVVDAKEEAWKRYKLQEWDRVTPPIKMDFKAGFEAGQKAGGKQ